MKIQFLKLKNWLFLSLVSLLGFNACHSTKEVAQEPEGENEPTPRREVALMYGVPTMNYEIKGTVLDTKGSPIPGVQVMIIGQDLNVPDNAEIKDDKALEEYLTKNASYTDEKGHFFVKKSTLPAEKVRMIVRDIDGEKNGEFQDKIEVIPIEDADMDGKRQGWDLGTASKTVNIKMENKQR